MSTQIIPIVLEAWNIVTKYISSGHANEFLGKKKETLVFRKLRIEIEKIHPTLEIIGPDFQQRFRSWKIDLVCVLGEEKIAIEGKYKILSDGAVPDNRKAAFFDLYRLEQYVFSSDYSKGLFLWLTNQEAYLRRPSGDSKNFSTEQGRIYKPGEQLDAKRTRDPSMPLPLTLQRQYVFNWQKILNGTNWNRLILEVG